MNSEDRMSQYLETGQDEDLDPADKARLDELRDVLGSDVVWHEPPADLGERIAVEISDQPSTMASAWLPWAIAATLALVLGTVGVISLSGDSPPPPVAVVTMIGTDLAPASAGTAGLIPTPNGWAIEFEAIGLPPASEGTFYQGWVSNGQHLVSIGTFHMRGDQPSPLALWSGVDLHEYRTIEVTLQEEGAGPESSGRLFMTGTATEFDDG